MSNTTADDKTGFLTSDYLDNTDWGKSLVAEFGRIVSERILAFFNKEGYPACIKTSIRTIQIGNMEIRFYTKDRKPIEDASEPVRICSVFIDGVRNWGISSIKIPELTIDRLFPDLQLQLVVNPRSEYKTIQPGSELEKIDFNYLADVRAGIFSLDITDNLKDTFLHNAVTDYIFTQRIKVSVREVIDVLDNICSDNKDD